jgi:hypothetical protein
MIFKFKEKTIQRLIELSFKAHRESESNWAKKYWYSVWKKLCIKYKRGIQ